MLFSLKNREEWTRHLQVVATSSEWNPMSLFRFAPFTGNIQNQCCSTRAPHGCKLTAVASQHRLVALNWALIRGVASACLDFSRIKKLRTSSNAIASQQVFSLWFHNYFTELQLQDITDSLKPSLAMPPIHQNFMSKTLIITDRKAKKWMTIPL